jgi:hypothetical protein
VGDGTVIDLVYCASGNKRFAQIAIDAGFRYGAQLPRTVYFPPWFADQNWKKPNREKYMAALAQHKPHLASVLDWESDAQLPEVLEWAEEAAQHCDVVMIAPKVIGGIDRLPRAIGGKPVRLGYSVPTSHGSTELPVWEFAGWPVHLLGGSPQKQMQLTRYFDVKSADGNMASLMATRNQFWTPGNARYASNRYWPTLREENGGKMVDGYDLPYEAFHKSCANITEAWRSYLLTPRFHRGILKA